MMPASLMLTSAMRDLPMVKQRAVENARAEWIRAGLPELVADQRAASYAHRLILQRARQLKRLRRKNNGQVALHRAVSKLENGLAKRAALAFEKAVASLGSLDELERAVRERDRAAVEAAMAHVPVILADAFNVQEELMRAMAAGASVAIRRLQRTA